MRPLKERGLDRELKPLIRRVARAYAMERISTEDYNYINKRLREVEAKIISMPETDETGEEVLEPHGGEEAVGDQVDQ